MHRSTLGRRRGRTWRLVLLLTACSATSVQAETPGLRGTPETKQSSAPPSATTSTASSALPPLRPGDSIPTFRLPVENSEVWDSGRMDLRQFFGRGSLADKQLVVTFSASWCRPCRKELRAMVAAEEELRGLDAVVVIIVADKEADGRAEMVAYLTDELKVPFPIVLDEFGLLSRRFRASRLPATFVPDHRGRLVLVSNGFEDGSLDQLVGTLAAVQAGRQ